ncbi:flagellar biosynthesis protein FliQ [Spirochaeta isovalerica]|uniref:Flagellar biosynthetic protein FliQ n=1 Tax=Spirochaeta isovalerica TaxID=150 RepID=A0A841R9D8_9SPIO|nr:flagellar biosynthesis protein FliQ [Spirochaeta isovalerica]MBB6481944.1 flagellar biosynthetic protein FliQ [Spirochaeta isovalerica]
MTTGFIVSLLRSSIIQTLSISAPVLLVSMLIGLIISIFQAVTSIQDQTLTFVPKIVAILTIIGLFGAWMMNSMAAFTTNLFEMIPNVTG